MKINYNDRLFRPVSNSDNAEISSETLFHYMQTGNMLTSTYKGGTIMLGQLIGLVNENSEIEMRYQQINDKGQFMTGLCHAVPEVMENGKIRLHEKWQWTSGDHSFGSSILEEV